jgi:hypothetical protein
VINRHLIGWPSGLSCERFERPIQTRVEHIRGLRIFRASGGNPNSKFRRRPRIWAAAQTDFTETEVSAGVVILWRRTGENLRLAKRA